MASCGGRLRKRDSQMTVRRHPKTAEEVLQRGAQPSARKFARNEVIPSIGTLLREFVLFQSGLFRGFDPGPPIGPCGRFCYPRSEAGVVRQNIVKLEALRLDGQYPTARPQV